MRLRTIGLMLMGFALSGPSLANAQIWQGAYIGVTSGGVLKADKTGETVAFDTNLDGAFADTVRTAAGADAFSPGFCGGLALNAMAANGCTAEARKAAFGGRMGYDWQIGRVIIGGLVDVSRDEISDSVSAFSTTPAFYAFTRKLEYSAGFRGRLGVAMGRVMAFGSFGPAMGSIKQNFTTSNGVNTFVPINQADASGDERVWGYQTSGGAEVKLGGHVSVTGEYLFSRFDNRDESTIRSQGPAPATNAFILVNPAGTDLQRTSALAMHGLRAGVNIRF